MSEWTPSAQAELERYLERVRESLGGSDVDPTEVIDDLKRHVAAEVATAKLPIVTEEGLRQILKKWAGLTRSQPRKRRIRFCHPITRRRLAPKGPSQRSLFPCCWWGGPNSCDHDSAFWLCKSCPRSHPGQTDVHYFDPIGSKK